MKTASPDASGSYGPRWNRISPSGIFAVPAAALRRFRAMPAHYHGQTWNAREPARAMSVNESTTRRCIDILTDALMVRQLQPRYVNLGKRQVKSPRIYIRDSGPPHLSLGIDAPKVERESDRSGFLAAASTLAVIAAFDAVCSISIIMEKHGFDERGFLRIHPGRDAGVRLARRMYALNRDRQFGD